jgi:tRNA nucleotidyltransferase (CCA-adding enzyme)
MAEARPLLKQVSGDRLRHEFDLILKEDEPIPIFKRLQELDLLTPIHLALKWDPRTALTLRNALKDPLDPAWQLPDLLVHTPLRFALACLVLLIPLEEPAATEIAVRLHLNTQIMDAMRRACPIWRERDVLENLPPSQFYKRLSALPGVAGYALFLLTKSGIFKDILVKHYTQWRFMTPITDGNRLKEIGLAPGPRYSEIIEQLRAAWIDGEVQSEQEEESLLRQLLD